jgi:hypothetical protein
MSSLRLTTGLSPRIRIGVISTNKFRTKTLFHSQGTYTLSRQTKDGNRIRERSSKAAPVPHTAAAQAGHIGKRVTTRVKVRPELSLMYQLDDTLWNKIKSPSPMSKSSHPVRPAFRWNCWPAASSASAIRTAETSGSARVHYRLRHLGPGLFLPGHAVHQGDRDQHRQFDEKAIEKYAEVDDEARHEQFNTNMEAAIQGDGSNTLDTVVSATGRGDRGQQRQPVLRQPGHRRLDGALGTFRGTAPSSRLTRTTRR